MSRTAKSITKRSKNATKVVAKLPKVRTNAGRIMRPDQAWAPAHAEYDRRRWADRCHVVDIAFDLALVEKMERQYAAIRIQDPAEAYELAVEDYRCIDSAGESLDDKHAEALAFLDRNRIVDPDEAFELAQAEDEQRNRPSRVVAIHEKKALVPVAPPEEMQTLTLPLKLVAAALLIAAKADLRYYLNTVHIHGAGREIRIVGTDGNRLVCSRFEVPKGTAVPAWVADGLSIPRERLQQYLPLLTRNATEQLKAMYRGNAVGEPSLVIAWGRRQPKLVIHSPDTAVAFTMQPVEGKFPDYLRSLEANAATLARGEDSDIPLEAAAVKTEYLRSVADVAAKVGASAVHAFVSARPDKASFYTFAGAPDTVLVVMPLRTDKPAVGDGVVKILGRSVVELSITAFKAHITRTDKLLLNAPKERRADLESRRASYEKRIAELMQLTSGKGVKQLADQRAAA